VRLSYSYSNNFEKRNTSSSGIFLVVEMPVIIVLPVIILVKIYAGIRAVGGEFEYILYIVVVRIEASLGFGVDGEEKERY
jgi:hypothetical protein